MGHVGLYIQESLTLPYLSALAGGPPISHPGWALAGQEDQEAPAVREGLEDQAGHAGEIKRGYNCYV